MAGGGDALLFRDLAVVLLTAGATTLLFHFLKQPVILGYLLAGFLVGPNSPGPSFVTNRDVMTFLGDLGVVFLLFALGLEFNLRKVRKLGLPVALVAVAEVTLVLVLGFFLGQALGWSPIASLFLGSIMSISSTTIVLKALEERGAKTEGWGQFALGVLLVEDVLAMLLLTGTSSAAVTGNFQPELYGTLLYKLAIFLGTALLIGLLVAPRFVDMLSRIKTEEILVVGSVGAAFALALLAAILGFSPGLGAFVAGALMAESPRVTKIEHKVAPLRDLFTAIFFVVIGAQFSPALVGSSIVPIILVTLAVVFGKLLFVSGASFLAGRPAGEALRVGLTLGQIGEFGFILAALAVSVGVVDAPLLAVAIAVSAFTAFTTPYALRFAPRIANGISRALPLGLHAFIASYSGWVGRMRKAKSTDPEVQNAKTAIVTSVLAATAIVAVLTTGFYAIETYTGLDERPPLLGVVSLEFLIVSAVASPFTLLFLYSMRRAVVALARITVPQRLRGAECTRTERMLRQTFGVFATVGTGGVVLAAGVLWVREFLYVFAIIVFGIVVAGAALGRSLGRFHREVEATVRRLIEEDPHLHPEHAREALHVVEDAHGWGGASRVITVPAVGGGAARRIGELRLADLTGASVACVRRGENAHANPPLDFLLHSGDRVLLVGDEEAILRGEEVLLGRDLGIAGGATELHVGERIATGGLRGSGVEVLAVRRRGVALAPETGLLLTPGDVVVVVGTREQVEAAAKLVGDDEA